MALLLVRAVAAASLPVTRARIGRERIERVPAARHVARAHAWFQLSYMQKSAREPCYMANLEFKRPSALASTTAVRSSRGERGPSGGVGLLHVCVDGGWTRDCRGRRGSYMNIPIP